MRAVILAVSGIVFLSPCAEAQSHSGHGAHRPYAGQERRAVTSLSAEDLETLAAGGGWGLARAAELNGIPGPAHLLELADRIGLSAELREQIAMIRDAMRADAVAAGQAFVAAEAALDRAFRKSHPDKTEIAQRVATAGQARAALRLVHLNAHLQVRPLLTAEQVARYNSLRGYAPAH